MSLEDLGNIGEFVAAVAVLVSLIYLAVQIRQNTRWLRASASSSITDSYLAFNHLLGSNPDVARVFQVGLEDLESLSDGERRQFINLLRAVFGSSEHIFTQHREGVVGDEEFRRFIDESPEIQPPPLAADVIERMLAAAREAQESEVIP